jgi:flagellar basal-body rod protein FlgG
MFDALYIAATGMQAQQLNVDTIANNLTNANTAGFKKSRVSFSDLVTSDTARLSTRNDVEGGPLTAVRRLGSGVGVVRLDRMFYAGDLRQTGSALDVAIQGSGFLELLMPDGTRGYSRGGTLKIDSDGQLVTLGGNVLRPGIQVPLNARDLKISNDGRVTATLPGHTTPNELGQLELVRFGNPSMLQALGDGVYRVTEGSGEAMTSRSGQDDTGRIVQGAIEGSNVKMGDEMIDLMIAQRAYAASVKVVQASDEMLGMVNNLRK